MIDLISLFANYQMKTIIILLALDVVLGIIAALVRKEFVFSKLGMFMRGSVLGYILGFAIIEVMGQALPRLSFIVSGVFVLVGISLLASILKNLGRLGLPLPGILKK